MEKIKELISKFPNGEERFQKSALFNNIIQHLANGADVYDVIDILIKNADIMTEKLTEAYQKMPLPKILIVDEKQNKSAHQIWKEAKEQNLNPAEFKQRLIDEGLIIKKPNETDTN